ncbi:MAG: UDP-3-O-(3-hydroxymyristoyl)glucosamine N-acyltransferase [bacterium]|nr:UDP-3-O-(3-hydroxymyristoyl)glucosamine N-acyltransferase [bacterium]
MITAKQIAKKFNGKIIGDENASISRINSIKDAQAGDLAYVSESKYYYLVKNTKASIVIIPEEEKLMASTATMIQVKSPVYVFTMILRQWVKENKKVKTGISKKTSIAKTAKIGNNVYIQDNVVIEDSVVIANNVQIMANTFIGKNSTIGENCLIYPNVTVRENVQVGKSVILHSNVTIGSDGFGFLFAKGEHIKVPQIGGVIIGSNVEIGANSTIDRATVGSTVIGDGTKIDNLVQIAHNVEIGKHCIICAQVGIAGSTIIGNYVTLAGQVGINGHISLGDHVVVAAKSGVTKPIKSEQIVSGFPATKQKEANHLHVLTRKLPEIYKTIKYLKIELKKLKTDS